MSLGVQISNKMEKLRNKPTMQEIGIFLFLALLAVMGTLVYLKATEDPMYDFGEGWEIRKSSLDAFNNLTGNPTRLCKVGSEHCLVVWSTEIKEKIRTRGDLE